MTSIETVNAKYVFLDVVAYSKGRTSRRRPHHRHAQPGRSSTPSPPAASRRTSCCCSPPATASASRSSTSCVPTTWTCGSPSPCSPTSRRERRRGPTASAASSSAWPSTRTATTSSSTSTATATSTGLGIDQAQRIMSMADGGNVLCGPVVAERLFQRDTYQGKLRAHEAPGETRRRDPRSASWWTRRSSTSTRGARAPARGETARHPRVPRRLHGAAPQAQRVPAQPPRPASGRRARAALLDARLRRGRPAATRKASASCGACPRPCADDLAGPPRALPGDRRLGPRGVHALLRRVAGGPGYRAFFEGKEKSLLVSDEGRRTLVRDWPQVARVMGIAD